MNIDKIIAILTLGGVSIAAMFTELSNPEAVIGPAVGGIAGLITGEVRTRFKTPKESKKEETKVR